MSFDTRDAQDVPEVQDTTQEAANPNKQLSPAGKRAMQAGLPPEPAKPAEPPPEHQPAMTDGSEIAGANLVETGAEKPEVKYYHRRGPEG